VGVEIVDVDGVAGDAPADLVGFAMDVPAADAPPAIQSVKVRMWSRR